VASVTIYNRRSHGPPRRRAQSGHQRGASRRELGAGIGELGVGIVGAVELSGVGTGASRRGRQRGEFPVGLRGRDGRAGFKRRRRRG
jgi:hypothetical protein